MVWHYSYVIPPYNLTEKNSLTLFSFFFRTFEIRSFRLEIRHWNKREFKPKLPKGCSLKSFRPNQSGIQREIILIQVKIWINSRILKEFDKENSFYFPITYLFQLAFSLFQFWLQPPNKLKSILFQKLVWLFTVQINCF